MGARDLVQGIRSWIALGLFKAGAIVLGRGGLTEVAEESTGTEPEQPVTVSKAGQAMVERSRAPRPVEEPPKPLAGSIADRMRRARGGR